MSTRDQAAECDPSQFVPEYAPRDAPIPRSNGLAVAALVVSLMATPLVLPRTPHSIVRTVSEVSGLGIFVWFLPIVASLIFSAFVAKHQKGRLSRAGLLFVKLALTLNILSLAIYFVLLLFWHLAVGMD